MARPPLAPSRRAALRSAGAVGVLGLAGCLSSVPFVDSCSNEVSLSLDAVGEGHATNEFATPTESLRYASRTAVRDALASESHESAVRGYYAPDPRTDFVRTDAGRFYRVETVGRERASVPAAAYAVDVVGDVASDGDSDGGDDADEARAFPELPDRDRETLRAAVGNVSLLHAPHYPPFDAVFAYEDEAVRDRSAFVPGVDELTLEWDGKLLEATREGRRTVAVASTTVRTTAVADGPERFLAHVGAERGVELASLSSRQRAIVESAIEERYAECEPHSDAFTDLQRLLETDGGDHAPLGRYDGDWYFVHVGA